MSWSRRLPARRLFALGLAALALLLGGCVYLRLLEFKLQLNRFERHFTLLTEDGLTLLCHHPVIRPDDIRWFGVKPERLERLGQAEHWRVRWVKQLPPGAAEAVPYDIVLELSFVNQQLTRVAVPERYFAVMSKAFLVGVVRSFGGGRVDQAGRNVETSVTAPEVAAARPRLGTVDRLLGLPTERRVEGDRTTLRYRYIPATTEPDPGVYDMLLHFDTTSGALVAWRAATPVGGLSFKVAPPP